MNNHSAFWVNTETNLLMTLDLVRGHAFSWIKLRNKCTKVWLVYYSYRPLPLSAVNQHDVGTPKCQTTTGNYRFHKWETRFYALSTGENVWKTHFQQISSRNLSILCKPSNSQLVVVKICLKAIQQNGPIVRCWPANYVFCWTLLIGKKHI